MKRNKEIFGRFLPIRSSKKFQSRSDSGKKINLGYHNLESRQLFAGDFLSAIGTGGVGTDIGKSVATDGAGNVYTTGYFESSVALNPANPLSLVTSAGVEDIFIT